MDTKIDLPQSTGSLELVPGSSTVLKTVCEKFSFSSPPFDPVDFSQSLVKKMYDCNALGLAANQVGTLFRVFALRGEPENFVCFNPTVVWESETKVLLEEACVSFPGLVVKIKRPEFVRVRFTTPNGEIYTKRFIGMTARCFLHEMDHLDGKLFFDRANRYYRDLAFKKWKRVKI